MNKNEQKIIDGFISRTEATIANLERLAGHFQEIGMDGTAEKINLEAGTLKHNMKSQLEVGLKAVGKK